MQQLVRDYPFEHFLEAFYVGIKVTFPSFYRQNTLIPRRILCF